MMWKCEINDGKKSTPGHEDNSKNAAQVVVMGYRTASTGPSKSDVETAFKGKEFVNWHHSLLQTSLLAEVKYLKE